MQQRHKLPLSPIANHAAVVCGDHYRLTVLTDGLLRYEWSPDNRFEDRASVFAVCRDLPTPEYRIKEKSDMVEIITTRFHLTSDKKAFSPSRFSVVVKGFFGCHGSVWRFGHINRDLGGTARTLDKADGRIPLGSGVVSRGGYSSIDDSKSMLFDGDGFVASRHSGEHIHGYLFAYGHDYRAAVKALYAISGPQPLLPRWALGNWWSRYYPYRADEYLALMDKFQEEGIPLSVAVHDMDWHLVSDKCVMDAGVTGWTGYTWNKKLFPNPAAFLAELHHRNLKVSLSDHPADGVQCYEEPYQNMAKALNHDTSAKDPIPFDITDRGFLEAFFDVLHRPFEDDGIDFWWVDWQQGEYSRLPGIDPLWMLNHYHFLDNARDGKRPLTFSRYAGPGSHRYPNGFSGDTIVTWASLEFQPEFTATASNIATVGGVTTLAAICMVARTTSSGPAGQWTAKEPWRFGTDAQRITTEFLRLRHRLLPYIYTMNFRSASEGIPLMQPVYWDFPKRDEAYRARNEYYFGSELLIFPIKSPQDPGLRLARVRGWLPPGRYVDIFSGAVYDGDRELWINRPLDRYPVFAKEGSIVPLDTAQEPPNGCENPDAFEVLVVVGADGEFELVEDDGTGSLIDDIKCTRTPITYTQKMGTVQIGPTYGAPQKTDTREWNLRFLAVAISKKLRLLVDGNEREVTCEKVSNGLLAKLGSISRSSMIVVEIGEEPQLDLTDSASLICPFLSDAQISFELKEKIWQIVTARVQKTVQTSRLHALEMDSNLLDAVLEYVLADSRISDR